MNGTKQFILPAVVGVIAVGYLLVAASPPDEPRDEMHLHAFGSLPIMDRGRPKPFEAMARTDLTIVAGKQTFIDAQGKEHSATEWALDALTADRRFHALSVIYARGEGLLNDADAEDLLKRSQGANDKVFRIENDQVLNLLGLQPRPGSYRYSIREMEPKWDEFLKALQSTGDKKEQDRDLFDQKLVELWEHVKIHLDLESMRSPLLLDTAHRGKERALAEEYNEVVAGLKAAADDKSLPAPHPFLAILMAYDLQKTDPAHAAVYVDDFNKKVDAYHKQLAAAYPKETYQAGVETAFNDFDPFYQCAVLYVCIFLLTCLSWVAFTKPLNLSAMVLAAITLTVHTGALVTRMYLMNRWGVFVTNLYGTAIFIGWVAAILGFASELIFKNGIGTFVLSVAGFTTMVIAQYLAMGEDTLEMMRAVLDTNFWLATHVTSINVGYAGTCVAGLLGALYIFRGVLTTSLDRPAVKTIGDALYGVVCFATLFSFTGTVLGGIWADQSWGRFWGFDPKENGALLIVIWNALILHARWGGLIKQRGMAVLALFGNIITIWSWWGVNMLGIGLHAYADASILMLTWVLIAVFIHVAIMVVGMLPQNLWGSFAVMNAAPPPPVPPAAPNGRQRGRGKTGTGIVPQPA